MVVGGKRLWLEIAGPASLKEKRRSLRSLKDRLRNMNLAVAEVADQDKWQLATLGIAAAGLFGFFHYITVGPNRPDEDHEKTRK